MVGRAHPTENEWAVMNMYGIMGALRSFRGPDRREQPPKVLRVHRLDQVVVESGVAGAEAVLLPPVAGHRDQ